jgi:chromosome segregation ATPase
VDYERLKADLDQKTTELGEAKAKLEKAISEKDELSGKGKQLYDNYKNLEADLKIARQERDSLQREVQTYAANDTRKEKEFTQRLEKLEGVKVSLEQERQRVIQEDEAKRARELEERDRLWADHENSVVSILSDLCKQPSFSFTNYTNTTLPEGFDGSLKPDFMIDFLGQYVIFDAKISKSKSLQTYVNDQVKKTVEKVKDNDRIYKALFLVVPSTALAELKSHHYIVDGYTIFVVSPEALPPILASFKRISMYEFAEQMDPQQRENIIQVIAELDFHINSLEKCVLL